MEDPTTSRPHATPPIQLTGAEKVDFLRFGFKSRFCVHLTGDRPARQQNLVKADDADVVLPDANFKSFLYLVVGLCDHADGYVPLPDPRREAEQADHDKSFPQGGYGELSRVLRFFGLPYRALSRRGIHRSKRSAPDAAVDASPLRDLGPRGIV